MSSMSNIVRTIALPSNAGSIAPFGVCLKFVVGSPVGTPERLQHALRLKTSGSMRSSVRAEQLLDPPG